MSEAARPATEIPAAQLLHHVQGHDPPCRSAIRGGTLRLGAGKQVGEGAQSTLPGAPRGLKRHLLGAVVQVCARTQAPACMLRSSEAGIVTNFLTLQIARGNVLDRVE
jgi:hypothetical protein